MTDSPLITFLNPDDSPAELNEALRSAATPYVGFAAPGSKVGPTHVDRMADELIARPLTEILVVDTAVRDEDGWTKVCSPSADSIEVNHLSGSWLSPENMVVSMDLIRRIGPIDEALKSAAMIDFVTRALIESKSTRKLSGEPTFETSFGYSPTDTDLEAALDRGGAAVEKAGGETVYRTMLNVARMTLAGRMIRMGQKKEGTRLSDRVLNEVDSGGMRIRLGFVRDTEAMFGCGGRTLGRWLCRGVQGTVTEK